ncbi:hypothetical protein VSF3289_02018 [Vibrio scophthalmi]|uniref:Uncharacterized protein n=1 Tax=Vibrio scophthalmi TaxID=45658 RepID=A0A1E3WPR2_9VIBR|nr:hypothetical protein VSF3289_02018 [Vibrio scophthalmi]
MGGGICRLINRCDRRVSSHVVGEDQQASFYPAEQDLAC